MNTVRIDGNLTRDPESVATKSEWGIVKLSIANNDELKKNKIGGYEKIVSFFDVTYWTKKPADVLARYHKGSHVVIQGRLKQDRWQNDEGQNRSKVHIIAENQYNAGWAISGGSKSTTEGGSAFPDDFVDDDIPF